jgi:hypothetical protein
MASDDEKDPPVPADLVGAPKRIRRDRVVKESDRSDHEDLGDEPND